MPLLGDDPDVIKVQANAYALTSKTAVGACIMVQPNRNMPCHDYTAPYYTILHYTILNYTKLYYTILWFKAKYMYYQDPSVQCEVEVVTASDCTCSKLVKLCGFDSVQIC